MLNKKKKVYVDPEIIWRRVIRRRLAWNTMLRGSWRWATIQELTIDAVFHIEPETYGPPAPK